MAKGFTKKWFATKGRWHWESHPVGARCRKRDVMRMNLHPKAELEPPRTRSWQGSVLYFILGIRSVNERLSFQVLFDLGKLQSQLPQPALVDKQLVVPGVEMRDERGAVRVKLLVDKLHNVLIEISIPMCL